MTWKSEEEINDFLYNGYINFGLYNRYFDFEDYENPLKIYLNHYTYSYPASGYTKIMYFMLRKSYYTTNDKYIQISEDESKSFYSIESELKDFKQSNDDLLLSFTFIQDPVVDEYERVVYSFFDMTGQIGGLYEVLSVVTGLFISSWVRMRFQNSIFSKLYSISTQIDFRNIQKEENIPAKCTTIMPKILDERESTIFSNIGYDDNICFDESKLPSNIEKADSSFRAIEKLMSSKRSPSRNFTPQVETINSHNEPDAINDKPYLKSIKQSISK